MTPDQSYREEAETLRRIVMEALAEAQDDGRWNDRIRPTNHWTFRAREALGLGDAAASGSG